MPDLTVFIVDDDASVRDSLGLLLSLRGYRTAIFSDAESFLQALSSDWRGCLLLDIRMPGMGGLALQRRLLELGSRLPVIVITGHGDVESACNAFKANAVDFLEKPLDQARLTAAIEAALSKYQLSAQASDQRSHFAELLATLTPREREVMELIVAGGHNRDIAVELGISPRTVEVHKSRVMQKLNVDGVAQLVRYSLANR